MKPKYKVGTLIQYNNKRVTIEHVIIKPNGEYCYWVRSSRSVIMELREKEIYNAPALKFAGK